MQVKQLIPVSLLSLVFFASGVTVGQKSVSRYSKYLRPVPFRYLDLATLEANVHILRDSIPIDGIGPPSVYYDAAVDQMQASVYVTEQFEKLPTKTVQFEINLKAAVTLGELKSWIPDLRDKDFVLKVYRITGHGDELFATWTNGNIVFQ